MLTLVYEVGELIQLYSLEIQALGINSNSTLSTPWNIVKDSNYGNDKGENMMLMMIYIF